jgi:hypothetical protein
MANHGAQHIGALHAAHASEGRHGDAKHSESKRMAMESSSKNTDMHHHHHHHPMRDEPAYDDSLRPTLYTTCMQRVTPDRPWTDCFGTTKSPAHRANNRF